MLAISLPQLHASAGYYYQHRDQEDVDGSGVRGRLAYEITQGLTAGVNISYDEAFDTRVSADLQVRFGGPSTTTAKKIKWENPTINALTASPRNRDVRVHDYSWWSDFFNHMGGLAKQVAEGAWSCITFQGC